MRNDTKTRIYRTTIRPIMSYETQAKTKRLLETTEMKVLRRIAVKTVLDRETSASMRKTFETKDINEWALERKEEWNSYIDKMSNTRIVRIARDKPPLGYRDPGRPRKRWSDNLTAH